jgi:hypothetical protein
VFRGNIHRHLLTLSLINWAIAVVSWTISAYLGSSRPTGIFVYTVLFVIGIFAAVVAVACFVLADFGSEPPAPVTADGPPADAPPPGVGHEPAAKPAAKPVAKPADAPPAGVGHKPAAKPSAKPSADSHA